MRLWPLKVWVRKPLKHIGWRRYPITYLAKGKRGGTLTTWWGPFMYHRQFRSEATIVDSYGVPVLPAEIRRLNIDL